MNKKLAWGCGGCLVGILGLIVVLLIGGFAFFNILRPGLNSAISQSFSQVVNQLDELSASTALISYRDKDYPAMLANFKSSAEASADAANAVGECYELGLGTAPSMKEALKWYKDAAKRGSKEGETNLGRLTANPKNKLKGKELPCIKTSYAEAWKHLQEATK